jgi:osmoprotectant transport system permease protein
MTGEPSRRLSRPAARETAWAWGRFTLWSLLLLLLMSETGLWELVLRALFPAEGEVVYPRAALIELLGEHLALVAVSSALAVLAGTGLGLLVTRPAGREFLGLVGELSSLAQTFPPVAVLALAVPLAGFGFRPTVLALFLYSVLPILSNTIAGIESVPPEVLEAAVGMGMTGRQILARVQVPLALPVVLAGVRTSVVINVGTATVGAVIGAGGLGTAVIAGLVRENPAFVLEGALGAALLALTLDRGLALLERSLAQGRSRGHP